MEREHHLVSQGIRRPRSPQGQRAVGAPRRTGHPPDSRPTRWARLAAFLVTVARAGASIALATVLFWSYSEPIGELAFRWWHEPDYLHGMFVPALAAYLIWSRRPRADRRFGKPSAAGLAMLIVGGSMRLAAVYYRFDLLESLSLIPTLAGLVLLVGGRSMFRWTWPGVAFLVFMVPLPGFLAGVMSQPLQRIGTLAGTFLLQAAGISAMARGNVILLRNVELGVVEACSGLRMLMLFVAVSSFAALLIRRSAWYRAFVMASAVPIAVAANVLRITVTGILYENASHSLADALYHDLAGCLMMPFAVAALSVEIVLLDHLFWEPRDETERRITLARALVATAPEGQSSANGRTVGQPEHSPPSNDPAEAERPALTPSHTAEPLSPPHGSYAANPLPEAHRR